MSRPRVVVGCTVVVALVCGCAGQDEVSGSPATVTGSAEESPIGFPAEAETETAGGPLDPYLAALSYGEDAERVDHEERQGIVAACMAEQGFDYAPVPYAGEDLGEALVPADLGVAPGTREFAEQYGYGLSTVSRAATVPEQQTQDPNQEMVAAMSPAEREAYLEALTGTQDPSAEGYV